MNREVAIPGGAGVYPLTGDVGSQAGTPTVLVTGIQGISVATPSLAGGEALEFNFDSQQWVPRISAAIQVNHVTVSKDYEIAVNVPYEVSINGVGVS